MNSGLYGGPGWTKGSTAFLVGCCFLQDGGGNASPNVSGGMAAYGKENSSLWTLTTGGQQLPNQPEGEFKTFSNSYYVIYDQICNGGVGMPSSTTLVGGDRTFFDTKATAVAFEYTFSNNQATTYYITDMDIPPPSFWNNMNYLKPHNNVVKIYDIKNSNSVHLSVNGTPDESTRKQVTFSNTTKIPYLCNGNDLRKDPNGRPEWLGIVINANTKNLLSDYARNVFGPAVCTGLSKMIGAEPPASQPNRSLDEIQWGGNSPWQ